MKTHPHRTVRWIWWCGLLAVLWGCAESPSPDSTDASHQALWTEIAMYEQELEQWQAVVESIKTADVDEDVRRSRFDEQMENRPDAEPAIEAALTLAAVEPPLPRWREAATFLVEKSSVSRRRSEIILAGMKVIARNDADYEDWHKTLLLADVYTPPGVFPELDVFFEQFGDYVANPSARAAARYHATSRRIMRANQLIEDGGDRSEHREVALRLARGLSEGVESITLMRRQPPDENGEALPYPTFAQAEQELLERLESFTVGGNLPDASAPQLTGESDRLSNYRGKVVMLDFWATWCAPCVEALPDIAELKATLPQDAFEVISINTDEALQTLVDFQQRMPMPWVHWYVGEQAPLLREWGVRGFPTYMLIDENGVLLARQHGLNPPLIDMTRAEVCELSSQC